MENKQNGTPNLKKYFDVVFSFKNANNTRCYCEGFIEALYNNDLISLQQKSTLTKYIYK